MGGKSLLGVVTTEDGDSRKPCQQQGTGRAPGRHRGNRDQSKGVPFFAQCCHPTADRHAFCQQDLNLPLHAGDDSRGGAMGWTGHGRPGRGRVVRRQPLLPLISFYYVGLLSPLLVKLLTVLRQKGNIGIAGVAVPDAEADRNPIAAVRPASPEPMGLQGEGLQNSTLWGSAWCVPRGVTQGHPGRGGWDFFFSPSLPRVEDLCLGLGAGPP